MIPQLVNAVLSRHNFILLGLRGQAKSRILRGLADLLDEKIPVVPGCEIHDDPLAPLCASCRARIAKEGDRLPIGWLRRDERYVEKLATPDVTIADMVGDIDPIKAAQAGLNLSDELTMHYGLLPRANRGIFAINELPDLAGKIQVGLFNILQEGDVQIKGYPIRLKLDVMLVFTANPEDYTARGKIITPLKDRIGSEIRTHYPATRGQRDGHHEAGGVDRAHRARRPPVDIPDFVREVVEEVAFQARADRKIDKRSGVSQRLPITTLELVVSNAERRAARQRRDARRAARHGRLRGAAVDHRQVRARVRRRAARRRAGGARPDPLGGRLGLHRHVRRRRHAHGRRVVRPRRLAAARRTCPRPTTCSPQSAAMQGCASSRSRRVLRTAGPRLVAPPSTSSSKACTRRRRSAAATSAAIRPPKRRRAPRRAARSRRSTKSFQIPGGKKKYYYKARAVAVRT